MRGRALTSVSRVGSILWQLVRSAAAQALRDGRIKIVAPRSECAVEVKNHSIVQPCERGARTGVLLYQRARACAVYDWNPVCIDDDI